MKFRFPQTFFNFFFSESGSGFQHELQWQKVMLQTLKVPTKFRSVPQSFCQNVNPVSDQDQDQDQDHNFTVDFKTRTTFYT